MNDPSPEIIAVARASLEAWSNAGFSNYVGRPATALCFLMISATGSVANDQPARTLKSLIAEERALCEDIRLHVSDWPENERSKAASTLSSITLSKVALIGPGTSEAQQSRLDLGDMLIYLNQSHEAEEQYRVVWETRMRTLGPGHFSTREAWIALWATLSDQGKHREAADAAKGIFESRKDALGPSSYKTLEAEEWLAGSLEKAGFRDEAVFHYQAALSSWRKRNPAVDAVPTNLVKSLAWILFDQEKFAEAEVQYRLLLTIRSGDMGDDAYAHKMLGRTLASQSRFAEAETEYRAAIEAYPSWTELKWWDAKEIQDMLATSLAGQGQLQQSEAIFRSILEAQSHEVQSDVPLTLGTCRKLALCLMQQEKTAEARTLAKRAYEGAKLWPNTKELDLKSIVSLWEQLRGTRE